MKLRIKIAHDTWEEEGPESLPLVWREYTVPLGLEEDIIRWLEWAEKQNERNKKWEEAQNDL